MEEGDSHTPFVLILVHGTKVPPFQSLHSLWTFLTRKKSQDEFPWTDPNVEGSFAGVLEKRFPAARIKRLPWSGWNTASAREEGAEEVTRCLQADDLKKIIVAHSHGGTIAMRALQRGQQDSVLGVACLGTPFLGRLPRDPYGIAWLRNIFKSALNAFVVMVGLLLLGMILTGGALSVALLFGGLAEAGIPWGLPVAVLLFGIFLGWAFLRWGRLKYLTDASKIIGEQEAILEAGDWRIDIKPPFLCIYAPGDEAAGWLWFCSALASLPYVLRHNLVGIPILIVAFGLLFWKLTLGWFWDPEGDSQETDVMLSLFFAFMIALFAYWILAQLLMGVFLLLSWLPVTFGLNPKEEVLIRTTVSLVPLYAKRVKFMALPANKLVRHQVYDDPTAQNEVCKWIDKLPYPKQAAKGS